MTYVYLIEETFVYIIEYREMKLMKIFLIFSNLICPLLPFESIFHLMVISLWSINNMENPHSRTR